jgi:hypothetical protein
MPMTFRVHWVLVAATIASGLTACFSHGAAQAPSLSFAEPVVDKSPGPMRPPVPTQLGAELASLGLDPKKLPPIETLDPAVKRRLMRTFSRSLGVPCIGCHAEGDFAADTRRKRVAKRMYNELVRVLAMEDGQPVFCDSCHQGSTILLDRRDKNKLADFMSDAFVGKLARADGKDHDCATCHGDAPDFGFITRWKSEPAPDLVPPPRKQAAPAAEAPAMSAEPTKQVTPPPRPAVAPVRKDCGDKNNLCPLQTWMRKNVSPAVVAGDTAALANALDRIAKFSPDPSWSWEEISRAAAAAARSGDMTEARKSCQACHNAYKAAWREKYRTRVVR